MLEPPADLLVVVAHASAYPNPVTFEEGDSLATGRRDTEFPGWIRVTTADGKEGWAPEQFLRPGTASGTAVATEYYCARELDTSVGERLRLHREMNEWVLVENERGETGWVPLATTRPVTT